MSGASWGSLYNGAKLPDAPPSVHLLAPEPYTCHESNTTPFDSTTYEAAPVDCPPFQRGTIYTQHPSYMRLEQSAVDIHDMTVSQLYTAAYRATERELNQGDDVDFPLLTATPDFDSSTATKAEDVARYVRELAVAYNHVRACPTPYEVYRHIIYKVSATAASSCSAASAVAKSSVSDDRNTTEKEEDLMTLCGILERKEATDVFNATDPQWHADASLLTLSLTQLNTLGEKSIQILLHKLLALPDAALAIDAAAVDVALKDLHTRLQGEMDAAATSSDVLALTGLLVGRRGNVKEILSYLELLEEFAAQHSHRTLTPLSNAEGILQAFTLYTSSVCPIASPVDCPQDDPVDMKISLSEGVIIHDFCVSPDRQLLAAVTPKTIIVLHLNNKAMVASRLLPEGGQSCWNISFTEDSTHIICTDRTGTLHNIFSTDLATLVERATPGVAIPTRFADDTLCAEPAPLLPSGSNRSLFFFQAFEGVTVDLEAHRDTPVECFTVCSHVHRDVCGTLLQFETKGEAISISVESGVVRLAQGSTTCYGVLPTNLTWLFLQVKWNRGAWLLFANASVVVLRGPRTGQTKQLKPRTATCFKVSGHVGSLAAWTAEDDTNAATTYFKGKRVGAGVRALLNFPLDEGDGVWLKETVAATCYDLNEVSCMWDKQLAVPCAVVPAASSVRLDAKVLLEAKVLSCVAKRYLVLASAYKGGDDLVVEVDRATNSITRTYRHALSGAENLYALMHDESELFIYHQRFASFSSAWLYTRRFREQQLIHGSICEDDLPRGSVHWLVQELYKRLFVESAEFQRIPLENFPSVRSNLVFLAAALCQVSQANGKLKVLTLLALTRVHFSALAHTDEEFLLQVGRSIKLSGHRIRELFASDRMICEIASALVHAGSMRALTLQDKVDAVLHPETPASAEILKCFMTKEAVYTVVQRIVTEAPRQLVEASRKLLDIYARELKKWDTGEPHTLAERRACAQLIFSFTLASVHVLQAAGLFAELRHLLHLLVDEMLLLVDHATEERDLRHSAVLACLVPCLIYIAQVCPAAMDDATTPKLLSILHTLKDNFHPRPETVSFVTQDANDVHPSDNHKGQKWRVVLDFTGAASVTIVKENATPSLNVLLSDSDVETASTIALTEELPLAKVNGGVLVVFGEGENAFSTAAHYSVNVDVSWATVVSEAVKDLLLRYTSYLLQKPSESDLVVVPLLRHGLTTEALKLDAIDVPEREPENTFAKEILENSGDGRDFVDQVYRDMQRSVVPSMRPAIQALLAILVHSGATAQQARDELKLRWFSGEWGSKFQGPSGSDARAKLVELATWVIDSVCYEPETAAPYTRRISAERRLDASLNGSISDRRGSISSRRSIIKNALQTDSLDQMRIFLSKEVTTSQLRRVLVERTQAALQIADGLALLSEIIAFEACDADAGKRGWLSILQVLWQFAGVDSGVHFIECLSGAGLDLEMNIRTAFHEVLRQCEDAVLDSHPADVEAQTVLTETAHNGKAIMLLLAVLCHPWDVVDCDRFNARHGCKSDLMKHLEKLLVIPASNMSLTTSRRQLYDSYGDLPETPEQRARSQLMGMADLCSLNRIFPNDFSVVIPMLLTSKTKSGILVQKNSSSDVTLRADKEWPLSWIEGVPRVFYFEVTALSAVGNLRLGLLASLSDAETMGSGIPFFYASNGSTHGVSLPSYGEGDVVGCGVVASTRRIFFTLNGRFLTFAGIVTDWSESQLPVYPTVCFDKTPNVSVTVNFGSTAFRYDFRRQHPVLTLASGPTWYLVATAAEMTLHHITARACAAQQSRSLTARTFLSHCCEAVCRGVNSVTASLMSVGVGSPVQDVTGTRMKQSAVLGVAEYSITVFIATMRHMVSTATVSAAPPETVSEMIFDAASVLLLLPLHSIQIATIGLLPELIPHVKHIPDGSSSETLVRTLFDHANEEGNSSDLIPFVPTWCSCIPGFVSIVNVQVAHMMPDAPNSIVLGNVLPRTGTVSFSIKISRRDMSRGHSLKGGYFIGVSVASLSPLCPAGNTLSWKTAKPPIAWVLHDTSPQLLHATNPTVRPNSFHRAFGSGDWVRVVVDRERQTVDFYREGTFLKTLFRDIPPNVDLVPFVQMYNDDATAVISAGDMTAPISAPKLLAATSVDVLRSMLTHTPFEELVARGVCAELDTEAYPKVTLALFNAVPDPRRLELQHGRNESLLITASRIKGLRCKFSSGSVANYEHLYNLRAPACPQITCAFDVHDSSATLAGLAQCIEKLVTVFRRIVMPLITVHAWCCIEAQERRRLIEEEQDHWDFLFHGLRLGNYVTIQHVVQSKPLVTPPQIPLDFTFSKPLSHPNLVLSTNFCGRMAMVPSGSTSSKPPFIAIAEPSIPADGRISIRCQFLRGKTGQILGGGYYFGVCTSSFNWRRKEIDTVTPEVWAIHDMDDLVWRLRHLYPGTTFQSVAQPHCIIVSGDTVRLEINREESTMYAFRQPMGMEEIPLGLIFDNLPGGDLYPFVQLYNTDAMAVLLPTNSTKSAVRLTTPQPSLAICPWNERHCCDECGAYPSERWQGQSRYMCNECADYTLCSSCFSLCAHSYHSFTEISSDALAHSRTPPKFLRPGMEVVIPATRCMYLRSSGCVMQEETINCVAEAKSDDAFAIWGMVSKGRGQFTVRVDTTSGEPLPTDQPVFIGVGEPEKIMRLSRDALYNRCFSNSSSVVSFCSDAALHKKLDNQSLYPYGFNRGATITLDVDVATMRVTFIRDWIVVGTRPIEFSPNAANMNFPLCCFVLFGKRQTTVSIHPEGSRTIPATVGEVIGNTVTVSTRDGQYCYVTTENCRLPLWPCTEAPRPQRLGYTFIEKEMVQCRALAVEKDEVLVHMTQSGEGKRLPLSSFLLDSDEAIAEERCVTMVAKEAGVTVDCGFVMSRLLLILSCLSENEHLAPLVMSHRSELVQMVKGLASVELGNEAPLKCIEEIQASVVSTANRVRGPGGAVLMSAFVPTIGADSRRLKYHPGMLVRSLQQTGSERIYRVVSKRGKVLSLEDTETGEQRYLSYYQCLPVKQCAGEPWYTLRNGLPCSLLEHTVRVSNPHLGSTNISLQGEWQGEITLEKHSSFYLKLKLVENAFGEATVSFSRQFVDYFVFHEHQRYPRTARICLVSKDYMQQCSSLIANAHLLSFDDKLHHLSQLPLCRGDGGFLRWSPNVYTMEAEISAEGLRMSGVCKLTDGKTGDFFAIFTRRVSFVPISTDKAHIEPLPNCTDAVIPVAVKRSLCETMHRLVVLLSRHLYLSICCETKKVPMNFAEQTFLFGDHPLNNHLISTSVSSQGLLFMMYDAARRIFNPATKPWDAAMSARLITSTLLQRSEVITVELQNLVWDALHAVVAAAHRCGHYKRDKIIRSVTAFLQQQRAAVPDNIYGQLFGTLFSCLDRSVLANAGEDAPLKDISAVVDLLLVVEAPLQISIRSTPTEPLRCLIDLQESLTNGVALPQVVDRSPASDVHHEAVHADCVFGEFSKNKLKAGKIMSTVPVGKSGRFYYEVTLPSGVSAPFALGWGTEQHCSVPSQHVGSDYASFAYTGSIVTVKERRIEYKVPYPVLPGSVIGCHLNVDDKTVAWSIDGSPGPFISIPMTIIAGAALYAFASVGNCTGMRIALQASEFQYAPDAYTDLAGNYTRTPIDHYDASARSSLPIKPLSFYAQLAAFLSDTQEQKNEAFSSSTSSHSIVRANEPASEEEHRRKYPLLSGVSQTELTDFTHVIALVESCMATANRFVDLDGDTVCGTLSRSFIGLKSLVRRSFRQKILAHISPLTDVKQSAEVSIRVTDLHSMLPSSPETDLQRTVLAQLHKQIGALSKEQWFVSPLFEVKLYISGSGHAPIDMGGPYRQLWTFLAEEVMRHPDSCYPHSDYHRNPLFRFINNSQRVALIPDSLMDSPYALVLFNFFGKLMGYAARALLPLDIELSPFVWKYIVDDTLTIRDYYQYVDSVVEKSVEDDGFVVSEIAEEIIPDFAERVAAIPADESSRDAVEQRRAVAQHCLVHSMDAQLNAILSGFWSLLPRRVVRCLTWHDLEKLVCGDSRITMEDLKKYIRPQLQRSREAFFWRIVAEMSAEQRASLLCFASGQRRLPLHRPITITENNESIEHLPRAQSCSCLITIPPYTSLESFREKLLLSLEHYMAMELA